MSILSYPERGKWGSNKWRGNCSGFIYQELFQRLKPQVFVDPMVGSGTSVEVAAEMGIEAFGLDLHQGFNVLKNDILEAVGKPADLVFSHPPYGEMIKYSGEVWGSDPHPDDLSRCANDADFHEKMALALINQRNATKPGGYYGTLIGDLRKDGRYVSYQSECLSRMPSTELAAVLIKAQHNTESGRKSYGRMALPFIQHEFILLWRKKEMTMFSFLKTVAVEAQARLTGTWKNVVKTCLMGLGGTSDLAKLYTTIEQNCEKAATNPHFREKIRQTLNTNPQLFKPVERGVWALA